MIKTLEKVRHLENYLQKGQQINYLLIDKTLQKLFNSEKNKLEKKLSVLKIDLQNFENQYKMSSTDFYCKFINGEMNDDTDFMDWASTYEISVEITNNINLL